MSQQVKVYRTLEFWYGGDKTLEFDSKTSSTIVYVKPKTDATEYLAFGDGTTNMDVKFFGATGTGAHMLWDESQDGLVFTGTDIQLKDSDKLVFGTGASIAGDVQLYFVDATGLSVVGSAAAESLLLGSDTYALNTTLKGTLTIGKSDTGYDVTLYGATAGCSLLWDESEDQLVITQTNAATSGVERTLDVSQTHTGIGASAEALRATITTNTKGGTYMNALFGKIDFATTGLVTGLAGVVCAELTMPGGAVAGGAGTYATFESEINLPTNYAGTVPIAVMYINTWGTQKADFDTYGYLFDINGVASGSGKFWYDATNGTTDDWIRCRINGVVKYIMLSDVQTEA